jgi:hypothetical protein
MSEGVRSNEVRDLPCESDVALKTAALHLFSEAAA